MDTIQKKDGRK
uniref:Uncharacterized protein n=1 Tax=Rhizophora mucronata TaxID=61149 RepID=A0A2P2Q4Z1_RHIMU